MTKQEAIQAMKEGKKVTHRYFTNKEWVSSTPNGRQLTLEDGVKLFEGEFWRFRDNIDWNDDWDIFQEVIKSN